MPSSLRRLFAAAVLSLTATGCASVSEPPHHPLDNARLTLETLKQAATSPKPLEAAVVQLYQESIINALETQNRPLKDMDPTGQASSAEIKAQIDRAVRDAHIASARIYLTCLQQRALPLSLTSIHNFTQQIDAHLRLGGMDFSMLDPAGERSAEMMSVEVIRAIRKANLHTARHYYTLLNEKNDYDSDIALQLTQDIRRHLAEAGQDYDALDATGTLTAQQVKRRIHDSVQKAYGRNQAIGIELPGFSI